jgi:glycosyltransferase involved in cell wall biosynthesis
VNLVCHVITKLELGGAQEVALQVVSGLDRGRFRAVLMAGPGGLLLDEAKTLPGVEVRIIPSLVREIHPFKDLRALVQLIRAFRQLRPAIVHTHSSKAGIIGRLAAWMAGVPAIVHTIHGYGITPGQAPWTRRILIAVERLVGHVTTFWIAVSNADLNQGLQWRLFTKRTVLLTRPGIDPKPFALIAKGGVRDRLRLEFGAGPSSILIGTVSCLKPQKAPEDFVRVAALIAQEFPEARFVLAGDGELRDRVEQLVRENRLCDRFRLLGWRRDIPLLMSALDVFALTSRWEGLPCVLLEARAAAIPVVATDVGGAREAIEEGVHGWLCPVGDIEGMARQVGRILREGGRAARLAGRSEPFPEEFTISETVRRYQELYKRLLGDPAVPLLPQRQGLDNVHQSGGFQ